MKELYLSSPVFVLGEKEQSQRDATEELNQNLAVQADQQKEQRG